MSTFCERLGPEDEVDPTLVPIATLSYGDLACLAYRAGRTDPAVVVWDRTSEGYEPITVPVAASFDELLVQLAD